MGVGTMTQIVPRRPVTDRDADTLRLPRRLIILGAVTIVLLAGGLVLAAADAARQVDRIAIAAETERAERALSVLLPGNGAPADLAARLEAEFMLENAHLIDAATSPESGEITLRVTGVERAGQPMYLAWTPRRFGSETFAELAPRRITLSALVAGAVICILFWLSRLAGELDRKRRAARELASRDMLTGLANRLYFEEELQRCLSVAGAPVTLCYLDLDGFKAVNDSMGHAAGDILLRSVGQRLAAMAGPGDFVARLGGDEFAIIRTGCEPADLATFARATIVETCRPHQVGGDAIAVGVSIGIATAASNTLTAEELLREADDALYAAKAQPGPAFVVASSSRASARSAA
jgi:diguanylate cyclase (GGDEF)-like protein